MEKITIDQDARQNEINAHVERAVREIQENAQNGNNTTELYFPKHIGSSIKTELSKRLEASSTNYYWCVVKHGNNQYTGRPESFTTDTVGDEKRCKVRIS